MRWHDVSQDSLRWDWACSVDAGVTWKTLWAIDYKRLGRAPNLGELEVAGRA